MESSHAPKPWFSIVVPVLNEEENIPMLLQSIFSQSHRPIEAILVDGGSTDRTTELIGQFAEELNGENFRISLVKQEDSPGRGPAFARNLGIERARGEYFLLLDGDFVLSDTQIVDQLLAALQTNDAAFVRGNTKVDTWVEHNLMLDGQAPLFPRTWKFPLSGLAFRRHLSDRFQFDPSLGMGEDIDLGNRINDAGLNPTAVSAVGYKHLPHTLSELKNRTTWYGRTALLWLKKYHSIRDLRVLLPALPFTLLIGVLIGLLVWPTVGLTSAATFLVIVLVTFLNSPVRNASRLSYLLFVRFVYSSFWFSVGLLTSIVDLGVKGRIDPSRGK